MKITAVKVHQVEWERGPYHWCDGIMPNGPIGRASLLRIITDEGLEGMSPYRPAANLEEVKWQLIGEDPTELLQVRGTDGPL